jgi:hypothetical protein
MLPFAVSLLPRDIATIISWQIIMADNTVHNTLFSEINSQDDIRGVRAKMFFKATSMPISGCDLLDIETWEFVQSMGTNYEVFLHLRIAKVCNFLRKWHIYYPNCIFDLNFRWQITGLCL